MLLCSLLFLPGQVNLLLWFSVLVCVITVFQRWLQPYKYSPLPPSAKINSLAYFFEYISPLPFLYFIPRTFLCVSDLSFLSCLWKSFSQCIQSTYHVLSGSWIWHLVIHYGQSLLLTRTHSSNKHHCVFSCDVLHDLRRQNACKTHSSHPSVKLPWCDTSKEKSFSDSAGLLRSLFMFSSVALFPCSFLSFSMCTYYAIDLFLDIHRGFGLWKKPKKRTAPRKWVHCCNALVFFILGLLSLQGSEVLCLYSEAFYIIYAWTALIHQTAHKRSRRNPEQTECRFPYPFAAYWLSF